MSAVISSSDFFKPITAELKLLESTMMDELEGYEPTLIEAATHLMKAGGKRLRPALCLTACELAGGNPKHAVLPAIGIEVFHNFTLVHDDIMDNAPLRRGKASVFKKWDQNTAILSGDVIMTTIGKILKPRLSLFVLDLDGVCEPVVCRGDKTIF